MTFLRRYGKDRLTIRQQKDREEALSNPSGPRPVLDPASPRPILHLPPTNRSIVRKGAKR